MVKRCLLFSSILYAVCVVSNIKEHIKIVLAAKQKDPQEPGSAVFRHLRTSKSKSSAASDEKQKKASVKPEKKRKKGDDESSVVEQVGGDKPASVGEDRRDGIRIKHQKEKREIRYLNDAEHDPESSGGVGGSKHSPALNEMLLTMKTFPWGSEDATAAVSTRDAVSVPAKKKKKSAASAAASTPKFLVWPIKEKRYKPIHAAIQSMIDSTSGTKVASSNTSGKTTPETEKKISSEILESIKLTAKFDENNQGSEATCANYALARVLWEWTSVRYNLYFNMKILIEILKHARNNELFPTNTDVTKMSPVLDENGNCTLCGGECLCGGGDKKPHNCQTCEQAACVCDKKPCNCQGCGYAVCVCDGVPPFSFSGGACKSGGAPRNSKKKACKRPAASISRRNSKKKGCKRPAASTSCGASGSASASAAALAIDIDIGDGPSGAEEKLEAPQASIMIDTNYGDALVTLDNGHTATSRMSKTPFDSYVTDDRNVEPPCPSDNIFPFFEPPGGSFIIDHRWLEEPNFLPIISKDFKKSKKTTPHTIPQYITTAERLVRTINSLFSVHKMRIFAEASGNGVFGMQVKSHTFVDWNEFMEFMDSVGDNGKSVCPFYLSYKTAVRPTSGAGSGPSGASSAFDLGSGGFFDMGTSSGTDGEPPVEDADIDDGEASPRTPETQSQHQNHAVYAESILKDGDQVYIVTRNSWGYKASFRQLISKEHFNYATFVIPTVISEEKEPKDEEEDDDKDELFEKNTTIPLSEELGLADIDAKDNPILNKRMPIPDEDGRFRTMYPLMSRFADGWYLPKAMCEVSDGKIIDRTKWNKLKFANGDTYEGEIVDGRPNGYGVYRYEYLNHQRRNERHPLYVPHGPAKVFKFLEYHSRKGCSLDHVVYEGENINGVPHGIGKLILEAKFPDEKMVYQGSWAHGLRHGYGESYDANGKIEYTGTWVNDLQHGKYGKRTYYWDKRTKYTGCGIERGTTLDYTSKDTTDTGSCPRYFEFPHSYEGAWFAGDYHGMGKLNYETAKYEGSYVGEFANGVKHGFGRGTNLRKFGISMHHGKSSEYSGTWTNGIEDHPEEKIIFHRRLPEDCLDLFLDLRSCRELNLDLLLSPEADDGSAEIVVEKERVHEEFLVSDASTTSSSGSDEDEGESEDDEGENVDDFRESQFLSFEQPMDIAHNSSLEGETILSQVYNDSDETNRDYVPSKVEKSGYGIVSSRDGKKEHASLQDTVESEKKLVDYNSSKTSKKNSSSKKVPSMKCLLSSRLHKLQKYSTKVDDSFPTLDAYPDDDGSYIRDDSDTVSEIVGVIKALYSRRKSVSKFPKHRLFMAGTKHRTSLLEYSDISFRTMGSAKIVKTDFPSPSISQQRPVLRGRSKKVEKSLPDESTSGAVTVLNNSTNGKMVKMFELKSLRLRKKTKIFEEEVGSYEGGVDSKGRPHGVGKYVFVNGDVYEGELVHGIRHGKGKIIYTDGSFYEGDFSNNMEHGRGVRMVKYGGSFSIYGENRVSDFLYEGEFFNGREHGNGKIVVGFLDKTDSEASAEDSASSENPRNFIYEGEVFDGRPHGEGKLSFTVDGGLHEHVGSFANGYIEGEGTYKQPGWNNPGWDKIEVGTSLDAIWQNGLVYEYNRRRLPISHIYMRAYGHTPEERIWPREYGKQNSMVAGFRDAGWKHLIRDSTHGLQDALYPLKVGSSEPSKGRRYSPGTLTYHDSTGDHKIFSKFSVKTVDGVEVFDHSSKCKTDISFPDGYIYEGEAKNGKAQGVGTRLTRRPPHSASSTKVPLTEDDVSYGMWSEGKLVEKWKPSPDLLKKLEMSDFEKLEEEEEARVVREEKRKAREAGREVEEEEEEEEGEEEHIPEENSFPETTSKKRHIESTMTKAQLEHSTAEERRKKRRIIKKLQEEETMISNRIDTLLEQNKHRSLADMEAHKLNKRLQELKRKSSDEDESRRKKKVKVASSDESEDDDISSSSFASSSSENSVEGAQEDSSSDSGSPAHAPQLPPGVKKSDGVVASAVSHQAAEEDDDGGHHALADGAQALPAQEVERDGDGRFVFKSKPGQSIEDFLKSLVAANQIQALSRTVSDASSSMAPADESSAQDSSKKRKLDDI